MLKLINIVFVRICTHGFSAMVVCLSWSREICLKMFLIATISQACKGCSSPPPPPPQSSADYYLSLLRSCARWRRIVKIKLVAVSLWPMVKVMSAMMAGVYICYENDLVWAHAAQFSSRAIRWGCFAIIEAGCYDLNYFRNLALPLAKVAYDSVVLDWALCCS